MRNHSEHWHDPSSPSAGRIRLEGVSAKTVHAFCDAIEFAAYGDQPTAAETEALRRVLIEMSREAHANGVTPERMLVGLKKIWTVVCMREPAPDVFDPLWDAVVRIALDAYETTRPRAAG
jgi:hypothetical protein